MFRNYSSKKKLCFARSETKHKRAERADETSEPKKKPKQGENDRDDLPNLESGIYDDDDEEEQDEEECDTLPDSEDLFDVLQILKDFDESLDETQETQETKETKETKETEIPSVILYLKEIEKCRKRSKVIKAEKKLRKSQIKSETDRELLQEYKKFKLSAKKELASLCYKIKRMRSQIACLADPLPKTIEQVEEISGVKNLNLLDLNSFKNIIRKILKDGSYTFTPWISVPNLYYPDSQKVKVRGRSVELGTWKTYTNAVEILNFVCSRRRNANGNWWIQIDKEEEYIKLMGLRTRRSVSNNNYPIFYPPPPPSEVV